MVDFVQPSFSTLVVLEIHSDTFDDLLPLRPVGGTLRKFNYRGKFVRHISAGSFLDAIPDVFPHLTTLSFDVTGDTPYVRWKVCYIQKFL